MAPHTAAYAAVFFGQRVLACLVNILKKAGETPDADSLVQVRLFEDMLPLSFQVVTVPLHVMRSLRAASGKPLEIPELNFKEVTTMAQLIAHAEATLAVANSVSLDDLPSDREDDQSTFYLPVGRVGDHTLKNLGWMLSFATPNAAFHLVTTYNILRSKGVPLGKRDYIVPFFTEDVLAEFQKE